MKNQGLIRIFLRHPVAANLLMGLMFLAGGWALTQLNVQFLPDYDPKNISVTTLWPGASAKDVEQSITTPFELELRNTDNLKKMTSTSRIGGSSILLEFLQDTNMLAALEKVKESVAQVRNLPPASEPPIVSTITPFETISKLLISGPSDLRELRDFAHHAERELTNRGIAKIDLVGLPEEEIAIQIPSYRLSELRLSLPQISDIIAARSQDAPAGTIAKQEHGILLRSVQQRRDPFSFENVPIITQAQGRLLTLGDISSIQQRAKENEPRVTYQHKPAIELVFQRSLTSSTLQGTKIINTWLQETRDRLGKSLDLQLFEQRWQYIQERITLLLGNGLQGLILISLILFLFLDGRIAFWVMLGIPTSFLAALGALVLAGGSINMVSLFAFIMTIGIIVDDTIVVGEEALSQYIAGKPLLDSLDNTTKKMLSPIVASSLTTICAFIPIMMVGNVMGELIFNIPLVVICVILASLIECFFVLPGHLHHSLKNKISKAMPPWREKWNNMLSQWRETQFRQFVTLIVQHRWKTVIAAFAIFVFSISLLTTGVLNFTFFPSPQRDFIVVDIEATAGTPPAKIHQFLIHLDETLKQTIQQLKAKYGNLVKTVVLYQNRSYRGDNVGEQYASILVEFVSSEQRKLSNTDFINDWKRKINMPPNIDYFSIYELRAGPPGEDIDIELTNSDPQRLKKAALQLEDKLKTFPGTSNIADNLPFGQPQLIFSLTPIGKSLGLTTDQIAQQLYAAFNGRITQIFHERDDEVEVRVMLPDKEREHLATLDYFPIITTNGKTVPLQTVATLQSTSGPNVLRHTNSLLSTNVTAEIDERVNNANKILAQLKKDFLPQLTREYDVRVSFTGQAERQQETLTDMKYGLIVGFLLIYIILAWVFSSYGWPLIIISVIPLGITGAIFGHWILGRDLTIISLFGFFGLAGIVINDSIILLNEYRHLKREGMPTRDAIVEAACRRLRAVLLTSLTTIGGLTPLLFERSVQAQFLIPMAISISFGLAFATVLTLLVIPSLLSIYEDWFNHRRVNQMG